jgi:acyl-coenzyme A thioesterase PaaI-like protein
MAKLAIPNLRFDALEKNVIREAWDRIHRLPGGRRAFSGMIGLAAPYSGTISAQVQDVSRGHARVTLADRRAVRQHLGSVHAIALCNLAELTASLAVAYSLPDGARFIVSGLSIDYTKKARGTITARCDVEVPPTAEKRELAVAVIMTDKAGDVVARASLRTLVGPSKRGGQAAG